MTTIAHSTAKATFNLPAFTFVVILPIIMICVVWAFTSPAAPKPAGPEAMPVPTPPAAVATPAQPAVINPQPAPMPVPTPPIPASSISTESQIVARAVAPVAPTTLWILPLAMVLGVALGLKLRRAANSQPSAFAR